MKILKLTPWFMMILALGLFVAGCETDDGVVETGQVGVDDYDNIDLNEEFGGLTATDEEEAFGDPYLLQMQYAADEDAVDDPLANDPEVIELESLASLEGDPNHPERPRFTFVRMTWGMLDGPVDSLGNFDESIDLLDWSGLLTVDRGIVVVRRVILFERPYDHVIFPRLGPKTVAWISHTGYHYDGLLIEIIERPRDRTTREGDPLEPNMLHFHTGPFTESFPVAELAGIDQIFPVDEEGNAIQFAGFNLADIIECPKGFLSGIWCSQPTDELGIKGYFKGRWVGLFGHLHGFLRGRWGYNDEEERIFVGKYISRHGRFRGFLRGTWEPLPERPGHGVFLGVWVNAVGTAEGALGGSYFHLPDRAGGFFGGRWATLCDDEAVDEIR